MGNGFAGLDNDRIFGGCISLREHMLSVLCLQI